MPALIELYLAIIIIYLFECITLIADSTVLIYSSWLGYKISYKEGVYKWTNKFVKFLNPFLPQMDVFKIDFQSISFSPIGISSHRTNELFLSHNDRSQKSFYLFNEVESISIEDETIYINKNIFVKCNSRYQAKGIKKLLDEIKSEDEENIESKINDHLRQMFNLNALKESFTRYEKKIFVLQNITFLYWVFLFVMLPLLLFYFGFYLVFEKVILALVVLHLSTVASLFFAYRSLYTENKLTDFNTSLIKILLSPFAACRSVMILSLAYSSEFHPLIIMKQLLSDKDFTIWGNKIIREYRYTNEFSDLSGVETKIIEWHREKILSLIDQFLIEQKYNIENFLAPELSQNSNTQSYCPRCLTEYNIKSGKCSDCIGISLISFSQLSNSNG